MSLQAVRTGWHDLHAVRPCAVDPMTYETSARMVEVASPPKKQLTIPAIVVWKTSE